MYQIQYFLIHLSFFWANWLVDNLQGQKADAVKVTVYYDASDLSSSKFITQQLYPAFPVIGNWTILNLVPYGSRQNQIDPCEKGRTRCYANMIHACAFAQTLLQEEQLEFANCLFTSNDTFADANIEKCATHTSLPYIEIQDCMSNSDGQALLRNNGFQTRMVYPPIFRFPTIAFNNFIWMQKRARNNFLSIVCSCINNPPADCIFST